MQFGFKHTIRYNNIWKSFEEMKNEKIPVLDHSIDIVAGADCVECDPVENKKERVKISE